MRTSTLGLFLRHLALSEKVGRLGDVSDYDLLTAYEVERGQAAFTELMRRHGPMVLRTCRRVLGHGPDAEDAFQATFILLSSKAGQLRREVRSLGDWLHHVAYQTALKVLRGAIRRRDHERQAGVITQPHRDPYAEATWNEILPILDAEVDALPDEARRLLIAFYLEEKTYTEVAAELGLPRGSLVRRLERAQTLLAKRLARRGITVSSVLLAILLEEAAKGAGVPAVLMVHTVEAARKFTEQATGIVSENVARLVKGGLAEITKGWTHSSMVMAGWLGLLGVGLVACQTLKAWPDQKPESAPPATATERPVQEKDKQARTDRFGDPLPAGALVRLGTTRLRHTDHSENVLFAPDGKTVASGGSDDTVRLWDVATGKLVHSLKHPHVINGTRPLAFSRDGKTLAYSTNFPQLGQWDVRTGAQLRELNLKLEPNNDVFSLAISSDSKLAALGEDGAVIRLWDVATRKQLHVLQGHEKSKSVYPLSFSPDNKTLASVAGDGDKVVRLWDVPSGKLVHKLEHPQEGLTVSFAPDGKTLASGGGGRALELKLEGNPSAVHLWDVATGKLLRTLEGHHQDIISLSFSRDGKVLASGSWDKTIRLWDVTTGKELRELNCSSLAQSLSFAPDGKVLASGGGGPPIRLWDVATGEELHRPEGVHKCQVNSVSFSPDGRTLATAAAWGDGEDTVRLWDALSGKPLRRLEHPGGCYSVIFAPDGKTLASGGMDVVCLWDRTTGKQLRKLEVFGGSPLVFSPDGKLLAAGSNGGARPQSNILYLWDVATGTQLQALNHPSSTLSVAFSPDGKMLAVGAGGGTLHLWDAVTGKENLKIDKFTQPWGAIVALAFSPDGKTLVAGNGLRLLEVEVATGRELRTIAEPKEAEPTGQVGSLAFSPSGRWLASANTKGTVRLWEMTAGLASPCHQFRGHDAGVLAMAFSPDGRRLASGSSDSTALIWDVTGLVANPARVSQLTSGHLDSLWQSLLSTDAARAYSALRTLVARPDQAVPFLTEQLRPKKAIPPQTARLLAQLDSEDFRVRAQASKELAQLGEVIEPALRRALKDKPSFETRRRIEHLLEMIDPPQPEGVSPQLLRWLRVVEVLEWMDTPAARELLGKVAATPPREEVGQEAKAALKRLRALARP